MTVKKNTKILLQFIYFLFHAMVMGTLEEDKSYTASSFAEIAMASYHRGVHAQYYLHDSSAARTEYEKAATILESLPSCPDFDCSGMLNDLGVLRKDLGDLTGAERAFLQSIEQSSDFILPLANLAEINIIRGDLQIAANYFLKATQSPKVTAEILYNYASFL
jgi:tetratricopeptide (TPR) repeat protein